MTNKLSLACIRIREYFAHIIDWAGRNTRLCKYIQPVGGGVLLQAITKNIDQFKPIADAGLVRRKLVILGQLRSPQTLRAPAMLKQGV